MASLFWQRVDKTGTCWLWTGSLNRGYGQLSIKGSHWLAHRLSYELSIDPIPYGLQLDHLCRNRVCVNPKHLEPVTAKENIRRGNTGKWPNTHALSKTHCKRGHQYTKENTYIHPENYRSCRICSKDWMANKRLKLKETHEYHKI